MIRLLVYFVLILYLLCVSTAYADMHKIMKVNKEVNQYEYIGEVDTDYWKTPEEFYADGGGDCEDFALVKYERLKDEHIVHLLMLLFEKDGEKRGHAVLLVDGKYILDNGTDNILTPDSYRNNDFEILFAMNKYGKVVCVPDVDETCANLSRLIMLTGKTTHYKEIDRKNGKHSQ